MRHAGRTEGLLGASRLAPPRSPPERPAAPQLAYGQVVEPDFLSVEGSSIYRMAMDAETGYLAPNAIGGERGTRTLDLGIMRAVFRLIDPINSTTCRVTSVAFVTTEHNEAAPSHAKVTPVFYGN